MALTSTNIPSSFISLARIGTAIMDFLCRVAETSAMARNAEVRADQIKALNAKTDAELAAMNLRRDDIVHYVFRDIMYI